MNSNNGREVKGMLWWNGASGDESRVPRNGEKFIFRCEYRGDRDEEWVCVYDASGKEIERHNVRYIASINW